MGWRTGIALASIALGGCNLNPFVCADDTSCSQSEEGRCEANGACSYPDSECDSGRRYSAYGPSDSGICVPSEGPTTTTTGGDDPASSSVGEVTTLGPSTETTTGSPDVTSSTSSTDEGEASSSGDVPDACGGCSERGFCVEVDGDPTCACDPGWTMVGLECLEDPCATATCYFVDSDEGDDEGPGTREEPWQTRGRAVVFLNEAAPGDHVLFRRGRSFAGTSSLTVAPQGTSAAPIVMGAYGPPEDAPAPVFTEFSLQLNGAEHVVLRDITIAGTGEHPCLFLRNTGYVTVHDAEFLECGNRGLRLSDRTHHSVLFRNNIHDVGDRVGIYVSDTDWTKPPSFLGEHHWIAGNTIRDNGELGITAAYWPINHEPDDVGDIKIVDNQIANTAEVGIAIRAPVAWVEDNIIVGSSPAPAVFTSRIRIDGGNGWTHIRGNIVAVPGRALVTIGAGLVEQNSFFQVGGNSSAVSVQLSPATTGVIVDNLVFSDLGAHASGSPDNLEALSQIDRNVYAAASEGACTFEVGVTSSVFPEWQTATADEANSRCEVVPGLVAPQASSVPVDEGFVSGLAPDPTWEGCDSVGAVDCDGMRRPLRFLPSDEVDENEGRGWEGPLIIQQHYPLDR